MGQAVPNRGTPRNPGQSITVGPTSPQRAGRINRNLVGNATSSAVQPSLGRAPSPNSVPGRGQNQVPASDAGRVPPPAGQLPPRPPRHPSFTSANGFLNLSPMVYDYWNPSSPYRVPPQYGNGYSGLGPDFGFPQSHAMYQIVRPDGVQTFGGPQDTFSSATYQFVPDLTPAEAIAADDLMHGSARRDAPIEIYPAVGTNAAAKRNQFRAEQAFRNGKYLQAADMAQATLEFDPSNGVAWLFASHTRFAIGDYSTAAEYLEQAMANLNHQHWGFVVENFRQFYGANDYVSQMERLHRHLARHPADAQAWAVRGHQYLYLGYDGEARLDFEEALKLAPNHFIANQMSRLMPGSSEMKTLPNPAELEPLPAPADESEPAKEPAISGNTTENELNGPAPAPVPTEVENDEPNRGQ